MAEASYPDQAWRDSTAHDHLRQRILNERPIPERRLQQRLKPDRRVTARVVWEKDGEELRETTASYWARVGGGAVVLVEVVDVRREALGVWLAVGDVVPR